MKQFTVACKGCNWAADFDDKSMAETAAQTHATLGADHVVVRTWLDKVNPDRSDVG